MKCVHILRAGIASAAILLAVPAVAGTVGDPADPVAAGEEGDPILVFGRGEQKIGIAHAASEGSVGGADLLVRPLLRVSELLEAVPGMVAAQHSGSGKASQYFLRGFNLDHGSDFSTYIDGVPMNLRSHGHGQGYLDLNGLIPETVDREDYRKGPYRADGGDFSLAGAAYMTTIDRLPRPFAAAEAGAFGYRRIAVGGTAARADGGALTFIAQAKTYDGPWQQPENLRHLSGFLKLVQPAGAGDFRFSLSGYRATWSPTEQIPERIVGSAACLDVFCSPDPSARGQTARLIANAAFDADGLVANVSAQLYRWEMFSNPVYAEADGSSAQIRQYDRRTVLTAKLARTWPVLPALSLSVGSENRFDGIGQVGVDRTDSRRFVASLGAYRVSEVSASLHGEAVWQPIEPVRVTGGLRADHYAYRVVARDAAAAAVGQGSGHAGMVSPKLSVAAKVAPMFELYANWGRGFHSNDVRGAVTETPVPVLVGGKGEEVGARIELDGFSLAATYWRLEVGSELRFVGDSNSVEPTGASRRIGGEFVMFWRPAPWLAIDAAYTVSKARYLNGDFVPNAFDNAAQAGIAIVRDRWEMSARLRHLGGYPLLEDNSLRDRGSTVVNWRGAFKPGRFEIYAALLNVFDSRDKDIAYFYDSYLPAFDAAPTSGRLSRVVEPRTVQIGVKLQI